MIKKKCIGCGSILQTTNKKQDGYVKEEVYDRVEYCERCFKIKNYGENSILERESDYEKIIYDIDQSKDAVIYLVDSLNINYETLEFLKYFSNIVYVIITKIDLLPKSVSERKIIKYIKDNYSNFTDVMCVSSYKNYNIDKFLNIIEKNKLSKLYVLGMTNSGKSTFINAILKSCGKTPTITTSPIPNTTKDYINIKINNKLSIIDTPGFVLKNSIYNYLKINQIETLSPKKELKVKTFQIKPDFSIVVDKILRIDYVSGSAKSFHFYMNSNLKYEKVTSKNNKLSILPMKNIEVDGNQDIVINGLGFIKITGQAKVVVHTLDENLISVRPKMI